MFDFSDIIEKQMKSYSKISRTANLHAKLSALLGVRIFLNEEIKKVEKEIEEDNKSLFE